MKFTNIEKYHFKSDNVISQVGNYGESFEKHLYPLTIKRGMNALYKDGGLHYIPPIK